METALSPRPKIQTKKVDTITAIIGPVLDIKSERNSFTFEFFKNDLNLFFDQYKIKRDNIPINNVTILISEIFFKILDKIVIKLLPSPFIPRICFN